MSYLERFDQEKGHHLYRLFVRDYYYDYVNLFTRRQISEYENSGNLDSDLGKLLNILEKPTISKNKEIIKLSS